MYRLRVIWSTKSKTSGQNVIPVFAFKPAQRPWYKLGIHNLELLRGLVLTADGEGILTICTFSPYCYRALENRTIEYFELHIKDTRVPHGPLEEKKTVATVTCNDMNALSQVAVAPGEIKMSCEQASNSLATVNLDFSGRPDGALKFNKL
ncbi:MAG: hypothetical protein R2747_20410 [Pyrinomonadaceae bacterium]